MQRQWCKGAGMNGHSDGQPKPDFSMRFQVFAILLMAWCGGAAYAQEPSLRQRALAPRVQPLTTETQQPGQNQRNRRRAKRRRG